MQTFTLQVKQEDWDQLNKLQAQAAAISKAIKAQRALMTLPASGDDYASHFGLGEPIQGRESVNVILQNGNGQAIATGTLAVRHNEPRAASDSWIAPRF